MKCLYVTYWVSIRAGRSPLSKVTWKPLSTQNTPVMEPGREASANNGALIGKSYRKKKRVDNVIKSMSLKLSLHYISLWRHFPSQTFGRLTKIRKACPIHNSCETSRKFHSRASPNGRMSAFVCTRPAVRTRQPMNP